MSEIVEPAITKIRPRPADVLRAQGVARGAEVRPEIQALASQAVELFAQLARPRALLDELSPHEFARVYAGCGDNQSPAPLEQIAPAASHLWLCVATVGQALSDAIAERFEAHDYASGGALDAAASLGADACGRVLEAWLEERLEARGVALANGAALGYSPGYCGWDVSGQRALFDTLRPEQIDVTLNSSCLMRPLKSISGVLVYGPKEIHSFDNSFPFCDTCGARTCQARMTRIGLEHGTPTRKERS